MAWLIMVECPRCRQHFLTARKRPSVHCSRKCFLGPPEERFWKKVDKTPGHGPNGDCWIWTGLTDRRGYGRFTVNDKPVRTHVFSYRIHKGEFEKGLFVCHSCDNPACQRPDHLWLGDAMANNLDREMKGRSRWEHGQNHHQAKLTDSDVIRIRADDRMGIVIAEEYGVSKSVVSMIKSGKTWKHLLR